MYWKKKKKVKNFENISGRGILGEIDGKKLFLGNIHYLKENHFEISENLLQKAQILDRIMLMPDGFDTVVGERGMTLSGGEKQRISIARALYADPDFLLLDEASSSLDSETEYEIMSHMRSLKDSVTIIAITHNPKLIDTEDVVIQL